MKTPIAALVVLLATQMPVVAHGDPIGVVDQCFGDVPTIVGTPDADNLRGTSGPDVIAGLDGDDVIVGLSGGDALCGGSGDDEITGGPGDDAIVTERGADNATGGPGIDLIAEFSESSGGDLVTGAQMQDDSADRMSGGPDIDWFAPEGGDDVLIGGPGQDLVTTIQYWDSVLADLAEGFVSSNKGGVDEVRSIEDIHGGVYADVLLGDDGTNWMYGSFGSDRIDARGGSDALFAGIEGDILSGGDDQAFDTVAVPLQEPMLIDLLEGTVQSLEYTHGHLPDTLINIENAIGTPYDDVLIGGMFDNSLMGNGGNDSIFALAGDDLLWGDGPLLYPMRGPWPSDGTGGDQLDGGPGSDVIDGGPKEDSCVNGETVTSCESEERASREMAQIEDLADPWFGDGGAPWWLRGIELPFAWHISSSQVPTPSLFDS